MRSLLSRLVNNSRVRKLSEFYDRTVHFRPKIFTIRYNEVTGPYQLCMRLSDGPGMRKRLRRGTEMAERRIFLPLLKKGWVCGDVGAHVGDCTVEMALMVGPKGKVYAYEAIPHYHDLLKRGVAANKLDNVECRLAAAGDAPGTLEVPTDMLTGSLNVPGRCIEGQNLDSVSRVPVLRLDDDIEHLNAVKIDCEGFEVRVLKGMKRLLADNPELLVYLEVHNRQLPEAGDSLEILGRLLLEELQLQIHQISFQHCLCFRSGFDFSQYRRVATVPDFLEVFS